MRIFIRFDGRLARRERCTAPRNATRLVLAVFLLSFGAPTIVSAGKDPGARRVAGVAAKIEPNRIGIQTAGSQEMVLSTSEDFTERVAVGSEVTAWYESTHGGNVLKSLEAPLQNFFVPAAQIRHRVRKIILLPSSEVPGGDHVLDAITRYIQSNLGWQVVPRALAEEIRRRAKKLPRPLDAIDPATGQVDVERYQEAQRGLAERVSFHGGADAVLETKIEKVMANFSGKSAVWDGVTLPVGGESTRVLRKLTMRRVTGQVPAATVVLKLRDRQGKLLWSNRRGLAVLAARTGTDGSFQPVPLTGIFPDPDRLDRWLASMLRSLLPEPALDQAAARRSPPPAPAP